MKCYNLWDFLLLHVVNFTYWWVSSCEYMCTYRGAGAGPAGTAATGPMLEAKLMNLIKGWLQKF